MKLNKITFFILLIFISIVAHSQNAEYFQVERLDMNKARITGYSGPVENIRIPQIIQGMVVTEIGDEAFRGAGITGVTFPQSVTTIGANAFRDNRLTRIRIPANVYTIEAEAFAENQIDRITIGKDIDIALNAFDNHFASVYLHMEKRSGTYIFSDRVWRIR